MPVEYQSQVWVGCDFCGAHYAEQGTSVKNVTAKLRKQGWKIGKYVRCPDCTKNVNADDEVEYWLSQGKGC